MVYRTHKFLSLLVLLLVLSAALSGCSSIAYYSQSIMGHSRLMLAREPIDEVIKTAEPKLKSQLVLSQQLRRFAVKELSLPDNDSYTTYVALERDYPVWTVVAAQELSLAPRSWCYPVIGCASYRGFFSKADALEYANSLEQLGYETSVGGASAYSTLGWFSDPILPSMLRNGETQFAEVLFHELAHQKLYIKGDSAFNEAFATVVGEQGALKWLSMKRPQIDLANYQQQRQAVADFDQLLNKTKAKLEVLYSSELTDQQKRENKIRIFQELRDEYAQYSQTKWKGRGWFKHWFDRPINNARLASISTYRAKLPEIEKLLAKCQHDFTDFYQTLEAGKADKEFAVPANCKNS